jgi:hypothetical protein
MTNIDYSKTVIYKIVCKNEDVKDVYVGSTTRFNERRREHKKYCINEKYKKHNYKVYQVIRANGGWSNWDMIEIIKQVCKDSAEAYALERYYYELLNCNMNTVVPGRTQKEYDKQYYQNNKDKIKEYDKQYYQNNKDKKKEYDKQYREQNKEKLKQYRNEYYQKKKEHKVKLQKEYYQKQKDEKLINYDYNATRNETLKQMIELKI